MGRSKRGKKKSQDSQQDDWEVSSERSFESSVNGDDYGNGDASAATAYEENPLEYITEALYEKRAATRDQNRGVSAVPRRVFRVGPWGPSASASCCVMDA